RRQTMAAVDFFLKIDGIEGESHDAQHKGEIEVEAWSWGEAVSIHSPGGGSGAGKVAVRDIFFVKKVSKATPKLLDAIFSGEHLPKAVLTGRKAGGKQEEFLKWTFTDVLVVSLQDRLLPTGVSRQEFSLSFAKIEHEYREQKADGSLGAPIRAGYDVKANRKL